MREESWNNLGLKDRVIRSFVGLGSARFIAQSFSWAVMILLARLLVSSGGFWYSGDIRNNRHDIFFSERIWNRVSSSPEEGTFR